MWKKDNLSQNKNEKKTISPRKESECEKETILKFKLEKYMT